MVAIARRFAGAVKAQRPEVDAIMKRLSGLEENADPGRFHYPSNGFRSAWAERHCEERLAGTKQSGPGLVNGPEAASLRSQRLSAVMVRDDRGLRSFSEASASRSLQGYYHSFSRQWSRPVPPWPSNVRLEDLELARAFAIQILLARVTFVDCGNMVLQ